ncbi:MAG: hypothetical protein OEZ58_15380, partial [Gammaproteobacteria bacterium]|nr:hypothetical protein [Gammaproteobacteria bacterium]
MLGKNNNTGFCYHRFGFILFITLFLSACAQGVDETSQQQKKDEPVVVSLKAQRLETQEDQNFEFEFEIATVA